MTDNLQLLTFTKWSRAFKDLKSFDSCSEAIDNVVKYYQKPVAEGRDARRKTWKHPSGYRKSSKDGKIRGEQQIEKLLLKSPVKIVNTVTDRSFDIFCTDHNFPLASVRRGQILCDVMGYIKQRNVYHPVAIEVKIANEDLWFAVVENAIQIRLARFNVDNIERLARARLPRNTEVTARGTWGLVVAPEAYFKKHPSRAEAALGLIDALRKETKARIILCSADRLEKSGQLGWIEGSYWPET